MSPELRYVCAWCGAVMQDGPPGAVTSHGYCDRCYKAQIEQINKSAKTPLLFQAAGR